MVGGVPTACVLRDGRVAKGSVAVPAARPVPASVAHAGLGVAVVTRRRDAATALRDVVAWRTGLRPVVVTQAAVAAIVPPVVGRRSIVGAAMLVGDAPRVRATAAVLPGEATVEVGRRTIPSVHALGRIRQKALGSAAASDGAVVATPTVAPGLVVGNPVPAGIRDLPASGLTGATTLLGPTGGRAATTSILKATSSGTQGYPGLSSSMGVRLGGLASVLIRSSSVVVLVLRNSPPLNLTVHRISFRANICSWRSCSIYEFCSSRGSSNNSEPGQQGARKA